MNSPVIGITSNHQARGSRRRTAQPLPLLGLRKSTHGSAVGRERQIIMEKSVLQLTQAPEFARRMRERLAKVAAVRAKLGLPKAVVIDGVVHRQFPDGRMEAVDARKTSNEQKKPETGRT